MKSNEDIQKAPTRKATGTAFVLAAALLLSLPAHAEQTSDNSAGDPSESPGQPSTTDQVLATEPGAMNKRIEELEAQLANSKLQEQPPTDTQVPLRLVDPSPATATFAGVAASSSNAETKAGKKEPIALGDWTWLNGNAQTKTLAFDSKVFRPEIEADIDYISCFKARFKLSQFARSYSSDMNASNDIFRKVSLRGTDCQLRMLMNAKQPFNGDLHGFFTPHLLSCDNEVCKPHEGIAILDTFFAFML
jgi:hypothetical protein